MGNIATLRKGLKEIRGNEAIFIQAEYSSQSWKKEGKKQRKKGEIETAAEIFRQEKVWVDIFR